MPATRSKEPLQYTRSRSPADPSSSATTLMVWRSWWKSNRRSRCHSCRRVPPAPVNSRPHRSIHARGGRFTPVGVDSRPR
eukprot:864262-Prorocentrum_minimum.AAC.1